MIFALHLLPLLWAMKTTYQLKVVRIPVKSQPITLNNGNVRKLMATFHFIAFDLFDLVEGGKPQFGVLYCANYLHLGHKSMMSMLKPIVFETASKPLLKRDRHI